MIELRGREHLYRARIEMLVLLMAEVPTCRLGELARAMNIHASYLCRLLSTLTEIGLVKRPKTGRYALNVPSGEFDRRWIEITTIKAQPNVIACQRLCGELEFRWETDEGATGPSWPWGDFMSRAAVQWPTSVPRKGSLWTLLKNSVVKACRRAAYRAGKS